MKYIIGVCVWIFPIPIKLIFVMLGFIVNPLAVAFKLYEKTDDNLSKPDDGPIYHFTQKWLYPWDNWSDGIANNNYKKFDSVPMRILYWNMARNPANNLRTLPITSVLIDPSKLDCKGSKRPLISYKDRTPHWFVCRQGIYLSVFWQHRIFGQLRRLWIGYKIIPQDVNGLDADDYRKLGAGFTMQYKRIHVR